MAELVEPLTTKDAAALYQRIGKPAPADIATPSAEHIRNTRRKVVDGIEFRSTLEADCYQLLKSWERAGAIRNLVLQPKFELQPKFYDRGMVPVRAITYKADFQYERIRRGVCPGHGTPPVGWERVVVEAKGFRTQAFELRRKMFLAKFPHLVYEIWTREKLREFSR